MNAPDHSEDVAGVEDTLLSDAAVDKIAVGLARTSRIAWKGRAQVAEAALRVEQRRTARLGLVIVAAGLALVLVSLVAVFQ